MPFSFRLEVHTGKLLFHSADNDPKDNQMTLIEVQRFFLLFDLNGDGDIKANEFVLAWKQHFGLTETQVGMALLVEGGGVETSNLINSFTPRNNTSGSLKSRWGKHC